MSEQDRYPRPTGSAPRLEELRRRRDEITRIANRHSFATTVIYANYQPGAREVELVNEAFGTRLVPEEVETAQYQGKTECGGWDSNPHVPKDSAF